MKKEFTKFKLSLELPSDTTQSERKMMVRAHLEHIISPLLNSLIPSEVQGNIKIKDSRGDSHSFRNYDQIREIYEKCEQIIIYYDGGMKSFD